MNKTSSATLKVFDYIGLLTLMFIGLRLAGHIEWAWWWVVSPLWMSQVIAVLLYGVGTMLKRWRTT